MGEDALPMDEEFAPLLILVVGRPASGKTTLARRIADRYGLPMLAKDDFKEILFDRLGTGDRTWSVRLGRAAFALLNHAVEQQFKGGRPFIVEAAYDPRYENATFQEWQRRYRFRALQIHCVASADVLVRRFADRAGSGGRHAGHADVENVEEFRASLQDGRPETLLLDGEVVEFDSTALTSTDAVLQRIGHALARSGDTGAGPARSRR